MGRCATLGIAEKIRGMDFEHLAGNGSGKCIED
jgi:hypothetical protein